MTDTALAPGSVPTTQIQQQPGPNPGGPHHPANPAHLTQIKENPVAVTRTELANHIEAAFTGGPATRDSLLAYAASSRARPEVIDLLHSLPDKSYPNLRGLWHDLRHVPIGT